MAKILAKFIGIGMKGLQNLLHTTKFEEKFSIDSIPEGEKARKFLYADFGVEIGKNVKNFGRRDEA